MDFTNIWEYVTGQNPMFLAASGSVALGVTLILTAGIARVNRFRARKSHVISAAEPVQAADIEEIAGSIPPTAQPAESPELRHLLGRLRAAGDKLERYRAGGAGNPSTTEDSSLKTSPSGVDYIFRAGTG